MRWTEPSPGGGFGFTTGTPWTDPGEVPSGVSVAAQQADLGSVWHAHRRLIGYATGSQPSTTATSAPERRVRAVLAATRTAGQERVLVLANLGARALDVNLKALGVAPADVSAVHEPSWPSRR